MSLSPSHQRKEERGRKGRKEGEEEDKREILACWYEETCSALGLKGRVRVAWDGVNATLGEARRVGGREGGKEGVGEGVARVVERGETIRMMPRGGREGGIEGGRMGGNEGCGME